MITKLFSIPRFMKNKYTQSLPLKPITVPDSKVDLLLSSHLTSSTAAPIPYDVKYCLLD